MNDAPAFDTPTTPEMVRWGFRLVLGRELRDDAAIAQTAAACPDMWSLHVALTQSEEFIQLFHNRQRRPLLGAPALALLGSLAIDPGPAEPGYFKDFLGLRTRLAYLPPGHGWLDGAMLPVPAQGLAQFHDAEEWDVLLRAAAEAGPRGEFAVMELGAGWGPWVSAAAVLARRLNLTPRLTAVEADAGHIAFQRQHFADNGLDPALCRIIHGIVGAADGEAWFPEMADSATHYGLHASFDGPAASLRALPCHAMGRLVQEAGMLDLLHVDIQGAEADALLAAMPSLQAQTRRVLVGTHGRGIEERLLAGFSAAGWLLEDEKACRFHIKAGQAELLADGLQVWRNAAL